MSVDELGHHPRALLKGATIWRNLDLQVGPDPNLDPILS
jgi:hypothetical protein